MPLTIKILSYKNQPLKEHLSASFGREEGTIGRSSENHFILPDPEKVVSHIHAIISYENGCYYLKDVSLNGTLVCNKNLRIHRDSVHLEDRDKLRIGDYDLVVSITGKSSNGDEPLLGSKNDSPYPVQSLGLPPGFDIGELLKGPDDVELNLAENHSLSGRDVPPQHTAFEPPRVARSLEQPLELPPGFDIDELLKGADDAGEVRAKFKSTAGVAPKAGGVSAADEATETSPSTGSKTSHQSRDQVYADLFEVFLAGAGIQDTRGFHPDEIPALLRTAGALLREAITGLSTILRGRAAAKSHLHTAVTTIQAVQNNPLKFSVSDETLKLLLTTQHPGYMDGVEAVRAGCADIIQHELALLAGVQAAVRALLARFAPQQFGPPAGEGLGRQRKAKCWEAYSQAYGRVVEEGLEEFFGEAFGRAYEEQLGKLRAQDHTR
jgi:type VI secretion system FHA domain protein